jgi:amino-acid N-acetyltransferase
MAVALTAFSNKLPNDMGSLIQLPCPVKDVPFSPGETITRKAGLDDIPALLALINGYANEQIMLPRTEFEMAENIRDFTVASSGSTLVGCGALHIYTPASAEVRSLAVMPSWKSNGIGRKLVEELEREATLFRLQSLFAFTYVPRFFARLGYREVDRGDLPLKAWKDCLRCPKFQCCDETAMLKGLVSTPT